MRKWPVALFLVMLAARTSDAKPIVAVFEIENRGAPLGSEVLARLHAALATDLVRTGEFEVVPPDRLRERLVNEKRDSYKECYAESCQIELGKELAAQKSLATGIQRFGDACEVTSNLYDLARATAESASIQQSPCTEVDIRAALRKVADELAAQVVGPRTSAGRTGSGGGRVEAGVVLDRGENIVNQVTDRTGFLVIRTEPPGATVFLNGKEVGRSPLQLEEPVGRYVAVAEIGRLYRPARQEIDLTTQGARVTLALAPAFGRVGVGSDPRGSEVWLDGEKVGLTPWASEKHPSGTYRLQVKRQNYLTHDETIVVEDGSTTVRQVKLQLNSGSLVVESEPGGAAILLDESATGFSTPHTFESLQPGTHVVRLVRDGYGDAVERARVERGGTARIQARLEAKLGILVVTSSDADGVPCEGELVVDGEPKGQTPWKGEVVATRHEVSVRCATGQVGAAVSVGHNQRTDLPLRLPAASAARATLPPRRVPANEPRDAVALGVQSGDRAPARVRVPVAVGISEGFVRYGPINDPIDDGSWYYDYEGGVKRTHVTLDVSAGLRFAQVPWLVPGLGIGFTVESPINVTIRPGIQWYFGDVPIFVRTALLAMVTPVRAAGFQAGFGGDIPLWQGGFLTLEADVSVWSKTVVPLDFRVGVGHAF